MATKFYTAISVLSNSAVNYYNTASTFFVALKSPTGQAANVTFTLPGTDLSSGVISSDGAGNLSIAKIVDANIAVCAAIAVAKLAPLSNSFAVVTNASGAIASSATTAIEIGFVSGVTSAIQTQLAGKANTGLSNLAVTAMAANDLLVASSGSALQRLAIGTNGQTLTVVAGAPSWQTAATGLTSFKTNWITADGVSKTVTHSLGTLDCQVQVYDITDGSTILVDVVRTSTSVITVSASVAPPVAGWRVLIIAQ